MATRHILGRADEVAPGRAKLVTLEGREVGIFNVHGRFVAVRNLCPHQGAPVCLGTVTGASQPSAPGVYQWAREGEILRCPWHGWEFDLLSGEALCDPKVRLRIYPIEVLNGQLVCVL